MTVFFDFDGTLVDVKYKYYKIYTDFIALHNGIAMDIDIFWDMKRSMAAADLICIKSGIDTGDGEAFKQFTRENIEKDEYLALDVLFDDTLDVLHYLKENHVDINIISMRRNDPALKNQVNKLGLSNVISQIYTPHKILGTNIIEGDPNSKSHAISVLGKNAEKSVLIGDTGTDLNSARHLGWQSVAVLTGLRNRAELERYGPDYIIEKLTDFKEIFEKNASTFC